MLNISIALSEIMSSPSGYLYSRRQVTSIYDYDMRGDFYYLIFVCVTKGEGAKFTSGPLAMKQTIPLMRLVSQQGSLAARDCIGDQATIQFLKFFIAMLIEVKLPNLDYE